MIVWVNVVLNRTVVVDRDYCFDNLCGEMTTAKVVKTSVTVDSNNPIKDNVHLDDPAQPTPTLLSLTTSVHVELRPLYHF